MSSYNLIFARAKTLPRLLQLKLVKELLEEDTTAEESPGFPMMSLASKSGDKIRFSYPNHGYKGDQEHVAKHGLVKGTIYTVADIVVGGFTSSVKLVEIVPSEWFNTVHFSPV